MELWSLKLTEQKADNPITLIDRNPGLWDRGDRAFRTHNKRSTAGVCA
jgi:hypothetical protein